MGDAARSACMSRSMYMASARKDNTEEVARRRAAMQQEIEQRQKLARKLQEEKMARAAAQKEERLLRQKEAQQKEMLRAKAVLDRRAHVLAEKEKEKKEAVLAKTHAVMSRLSAQHKARPLYAFGSSTPRELGYLTQLTKEQKVYDRKLTPSDRSSTATPGSSGRLTSTPPNGPRAHTLGTLMTRSLYVARPETKPRQKPASNIMTQSVMITTKTTHRRSPARHLATANITDRRNEVPKMMKKLVQNGPPLQGRITRTNQSQPSKANEEVVKTKIVSKGVLKSTEIKMNDELKQEDAKLKKLQDDKLNETFVVLEKSDVKIQDDSANGEGKTDGDVVRDMNITVENSESGKTDDDTSTTIREPIRIEANDEVSENKENKNQLTNEIDEKRAIDISKRVADALLLDPKPHKEGTFVIDKKANSTVKMTDDENVCGRKADDNKKEMVEEKGNGFETSDAIAKQEEGMDTAQKSQTVHDLLTTQESAVGAVQEKPESGREIHVQEESLTLNKGIQNDEHDSAEVVEAVVTMDVKDAKHIFSDAEANGSITKMDVEEETSQDSPTSHVNESVAEDVKLAGERRLMEEKRRVQEERLEREQREREMRKAKLASIMSRTRGAAPPMAVVTPTTQTTTSEVISREPLKLTDRLPSPVESAPVKNALSHTAASVLQKLATTNPKLLSVLQRNGSNPSLADELSAADPSLSVTLPGQPDEPISAHEGSSAVRHLPFEPDASHRPVAMK